MSMGKRVLVVEDHADSAELLSRVLVRHGHTVSVARTAADAMALCRAATFDVLLCDIGLPDLSGLELVQLVKRECPNLRAIAVSGYGMRGDVDAAIRAGFDAHLLKPVTVEQITNYL